MQRRMQRRSKRAAFTLFSTSELLNQNFWTLEEIRKYLGRFKKYLEKIWMYLRTFESILETFSSSDDRVEILDVAMVKRQRQMIHLHWYTSESTSSYTFGSLASYTSGSTSRHTSRYTSRDPHEAFVHICTQYKLKTNELSSSVLAFREW